MAKDFYTDFLGELAALDDFLARGRRFGESVEPEDPDVRRLMESLAFFSTRTRETASRRVSEAISQLSKGLLDDFMLSQPARIMLRARPGPALAEPAQLPRGTTVELETSEGVVAQFATMRALNILPIELDHVVLQDRAGGGARLLLRLRGFRSLAAATTRLTLQVSLPGRDYARTRAFFWMLEHQLEHFGVAYGSPPDSKQQGQDCRYRFGASLDGDNSEAAMRSEQRSLMRSGAVAKIRQFLHFPQMGLYLDVELPPPDDNRLWRQAWLCLDFAQWPEDQAVTPDMFQLHTVPIENLFVGDAQAFKADGTETDFPVLPGQQASTLAFHSICEVTQQTPSGIELLLPTHLSGTGESWALELDNQVERAPMLSLRLPGAFLAPRLISVRARWYQPEFDRRAFGKLTPKLRNRFIEGVEFETLGSLTPHRESPLADDAAQVLHVLSRRSKWELSREDIVMMMIVLGADEHSAHGDIAALLARVDVHNAPATVGGSPAGVMNVYRIDLVDDARLPENLGRVDDYLREAERLLDAWSNNPASIDASRGRDRAQVELRSVS